MFIPLGFDNGTRKKKGSRRLLLRNLAYIAIPVGLSGVL